MRADSSLLIQAMREGADCEHLFLADVGEQIGWRGGQDEECFLRSDQTIRRRRAEHSRQPEHTNPDFRRYRVFLRIRQALLAPAEGYE